MRYETQVVLNAAGDAGQTGSRASNARQNGNVTDRKSGEQRATQWKQDGGEGTSKEAENYFVGRPQQKPNKLAVTPKHTKRKTLTIRKG